MNELTLKDAFPTEVQEHHLGIIQVSVSVMEQFGITIVQADTQGQLCDTGVFEQLHTRLLLPTSYTILALFHLPNRYTWNIWVESPDLPVVTAYAEAPFIEPRYTRIHREDTTAYTQLIEMRTGDWKQDYRAEKLIVEFEGATLDNFT